MNSDNLILTGISEEFQSGFKAHRHFRSPSGMRCQTHILHTGMVFHFNFENDTAA